MKRPKSKPADAKEEEAELGEEMPDPSGWPIHPSERRDFLNRIRVFPAEISRWRRRLIETIKCGDKRFVLENGDGGAALAEKLDAGISFLRELARILSVLYGNPDLGNKHDPVDELVYIILSRKTFEDAYQKGYEVLKARFSSWDELLEAPRKEVEALIRSGGLSDKKTASLFGALGKPNPFWSTNRFALSLSAPPMGAAFDGRFQEGRKGFALPMVSDLCCRNFEREFKNRGTTRKPRCGPTAH